MNASKAEWLPIVKEHEEKLRYESFTRKDALELGLKVIELAERQYKQNVVVRIVADGIPVFCHSMDGCDMRNEWWMSAKLNAAMETKSSSLLAMLERVHGCKEMEYWCKYENSFLLCGGCFPLKLKSGEIRGYVIVSALTHEEDHQIIVDAMSEILDIPINTILI